MFFNLAQELLPKTGVNNMDELIRDFLDFLAAEYKYLDQVKVFLTDIPEMITDGRINELEFQNFIEKYEIQNAHLLYEKNRYKEKIGEKLNIKKEQVSFRLLVKMGYRDFDSIGRNELKISNEISMSLLRISIFLRNYAKLQYEFKRLNSFLFQHDYSSRGVAVEYTYRPGRNFYGEA